MNAIQLPLQGRAALVTGGTRGIGAAIVRRLARDGADIAFSYAASEQRAREIAGEVEALGRRALAVRADQASPAADLARNITVNVVQPGPINTEMNPDDSAFAATLKCMVSLGRYGKPEEIAAAVAFLAGPDAGYITGATLNVDGGLSA